MYVFAGFESSTYVELALQELKELEIDEKDIVFIEMKKPEQKKTKNVFDTMHYSDGMSVMDGMSAWGAVGMVLGMIYGSVWRYGPITGGLLGLLLGGFIGYWVDRWRKRKRKVTKPLSKNVEILLLIRCETKAQAKIATSICEQNFCLCHGVRQKSAS